MSEPVDNFWPSKRMCEELTAAFPDKIKHRVFDEDGHFFLEYPEPVKYMIEILENNLASYKTPPVL
ncbi:MAG: hypothetical protein PQJ46_13345 [Spirochaetales bacterium]|nr:hypothetical protein [Spirochaetales bacterium]